MNVKYTKILGQTSNYAGPILGKLLGYYWSKKPII